MNRVPPYGPRSAQLVFIGQSPGREEDRQQRPFVGPAGQVMRELCDEVGIVHEQAFWTNICDRVLLGSDTPGDDDIVIGRLRLKKELSKLPNLKMVVLVGVPASHLVFGGLMKAMSGREGMLFDRYPCISSYHPSAILRSKSANQAAYIEIESKQTLTRAAEALIDASTPSRQKVAKPTRKSGIAELLSATSKPKTKAPVKATERVAEDNWLKLALDEQLEREQPLWESPRNYFRASEAGEGCLRSLVLSAMGHRMPIEAKKARIFRVGIAIEAANVAAVDRAGILVSKQGEVKYDDPPIVGHYDLVVARPSDNKELLGEIKSIRASLFKKLPAEHGPVPAGSSPLAKSHYRYMCQWTMYVCAPNLDFDEGFMLFENKDNQKQKVYWLLRDAQLLEEILDRHREAAPYILSDPQRVPPVDAIDPTHSCTRAYLCKRIPAEGADYDAVRAIDAKLRG